ncbi:hypothetical protein EVAR_76339_1 [Eumeta japonica]|uniref:Uncharacterized protein n=1 Tax=Eumeta variegata TaxID=151549 RepID=A0A4C1T8H4_EUMVA|nr:hypothetical protein EVAR_76339_1 [Eumeta japonica]
MSTRPIGQPRIVTHTPNSSRNRISNPILSLIRLSPHLHSVKATKHQAKDDSDNTADAEGGGGVEGPGECGTPRGRPPTAARGRVIRLSVSSAQDASAQDERHRLLLVTDIRTLPV